MSCKNSWEQRKLGELVAEISAGKSINSSNEPASDDDIAVLKTSCVSYGHFDPNEHKKVVENERELVSCPVTANSLIVSRMNTPDRVGACGFSAASYAYLYLPDRLWRVTLKPEADPYFLHEIIASDSGQTSIKVMASGTSGSMHNVPKTAFLNMKLDLPRETTEQHQIGAFFNQLDSLIALHQRQLDSLKKNQTVMPGKMFV